MNSVSVFLVLQFAVSVMCSPEYIPDETIKTLLNWDTLIPAVEEALGDLTINDVIQPPRLRMSLPAKEGYFLGMAAYSKSKEVLGCKIATIYRNNDKINLPTVMATILFVDPDTGKFKAIMEGTEITTWRTAAATAAATNVIYKGEKKVLAILGAGIQGRIHALALKHLFNFQEVRIWNRTPARAEKLCKELGPWAVHYTSNEECVRGADVIVTATYASSPIVMLDWVKKGAHINAVGVGKSNRYSELEYKIYKDNKTNIYVDQMEFAVKELKDLTDDNVPLKGEVGQIIHKNITVPHDSERTVFHSIGLAIEDVIAAKLVYDEYIKRKNNSTL